MGLSSVIWVLAAEASSWGRADSRIPVSMGPGLTALTRIPWGTSSLARLRVIERSAALAAA